MQRWEEFERSIEQSDSAERLRELRGDIHAAFEAFPAALLDGRAVEMQNRLHDAVIRKTLRLTEERVRASHSGAPPVSSFAFLLFGSGGRKEQTLWSDQDNGLIYAAADGADADEAARYAAALGEAFRAALEAVAYPPCEGNVLSSNPMWRQSTAEWRETLQGWFERAEFESVRYLLIVADARAVYGDGSLAEALHDDYFAFAAARRGIMPRMLQNTLRHKVLLGLLGNLITEPYGEDAGGIDVKYGAYLPMVNAIRLLSVAAQVRETSTLARIRILPGKLGVTAAMASDWEEAFRVVLKLRAMTPFQFEGGVYSTRGILSAKQLTKDVKREIKLALRVGAELQRLVRRKFGTEDYRI